MAARGANDRSAQRLVFERLATFRVLQSRGPRLAQIRARACDLRFDLRIAESNAFGARHGRDFMHQGTKQFDAAGIVNDVTDLAPHERRHGIEGRVPEQLLPADSAQAHRQLAENPRTAEQLGESLGACGIASIQFAELN